MTGSCEYCGEAYRGEPDEIHQCKDGGKAMREAFGIRRCAWCGYPLMTGAVISPAGQQFCAPCGLRS